MHAMLELPYSDPVNNPHGLFLMYEGSVCLNDIFGAMHESLLKGLFQNMQVTVKVCLTIIYVYTY